MKEHADINIRSINVLEGHLYYPPTLNLDIEIGNLSQYSVNIDRVLLEIEVAIGSSSWRIGSFWYLKKEAIRVGDFGRLITECPIDFETVERINDKMLSEGRDIVWSVRASLYFDDQTSPKKQEIQGDSSDQKPPWTPRSTWEKWYDTWKSRSSPKPYQVIKDLKDIQDRADSTLRDLEGERKKIEELERTMMILQKTAEERYLLEDEKKDLRKRITELEKTLQDFSLLINIGEPIGVRENWLISACALSLIEIMVNKKLEEYGFKKEGEFRKRLNRLADIMKKEEEKEISKIITNVLYDMRNKVLHGGETPTSDERRKIVGLVEELANELWKKEKESMK